MEEKIKNYLNTQTKIDIGGVSNIKLLADGIRGNHINYKIVAAKGDFVLRLTKPNDIVNSANLSDEYSILKLIETYGVGPKPVTIDVEWQLPFIIEEYFVGAPISHTQNADEKTFQKAIDLMIKISNVAITENQFPFKFAYSAYSTDLKSWEKRLEEIGDFYKNEGSIIKELKSVAESAKKILEKKDKVLRRSKKEFIYNDVHPGNLFILKNRDVKFIDWQKVSLGDPTYMAALFARRFSDIWKMKAADFKVRVITAYSGRKSIPNFQELMDARILERAVADMIWVVWAEMKSGNRGILKLEDNKYYAEAKSLAAGY